MAGEDVSEETTQVLVVGLLVEDEVAAVVHVLHHLRRKVHAERLEGVLKGRGTKKSHFDLRFHDFVVFAFFGCCVETLPGEFPAHEIEQHIAERLQVISSTLLNTEVVA